MPRCTAKTKQGTQCMRMSQQNSQMCHLHTRPLQATQAKTQTVQNSLTVQAVVDQMTKAMSLIDDISQASTYINANKNSTINVEFQFNKYLHAGVHKRIYDGPLYVLRHVLKNETISTKTLELFKEKLQKSDFLAPIKRNLLSLLSKEPPEIMIEMISFANYGKMTKREKTTIQDIIKKSRISFPANAGDFKVAPPGAGPRPLNIMWA